MLQFESEMTSSPSDSSQNVDLVVELQSAFQFQGNHFWQINLDQMVGSEVTLEQTVEKGCNHNSLQMSLAPQYSEKSYSELICNPSPSSLGSTVSKQ